MVVAIKVKSIVSDVAPKSAERERERERELVVNTATYKHELTHTKERLYVPA